jgi:hypothetical protein
MKTEKAKQGNIFSSHKLQLILLGIPNQWEMRRRAPRMGKGEAQTKF